MPPNRGNLVASRRRLSTDTVSPASPSGGASTALCKSSSTREGRHRTRVQRLDEKLQHNNTERAVERARRTARVTQILEECTDVRCLVDIRGHAKTNASEQSFTEMVWRKHTQKTQPTYSQTFMRHLPGKRTKRSLFCHTSGQTYQKWTLKKYLLS